MIDTPNPIPESKPKIVERWSLLHYQLTWQKPHIAEVGLNALKLIEELSTAEAKLSLAEQKIARLEDYIETLELQATKRECKVDALEAREKVLVAQASKLEAERDSAAERATEFFHYIERLEADDIKSEEKIDVLEEREKVLVDALKLVEWTWWIYDYRYCWICSAYKSQGHDSNCVYAAFASVTKEPAK